MNTSNEPLNYEYAYIEMRNLLAYVLNVIAGEVNDGVTPIDIGIKESDALKQRRALAYDVVCKQTYHLHKSAPPTTLDQHDTLIDTFMHYLTFITSDDSPNELFVDLHAKLNTLRCPNLDNDLNEAMKSESGSDNA
ncbi:hypothetical protein ACU5EH_25295 [Aliivibrio salmonicida]|uniref:hypothetical protein n=1 Tax=Aliivibrio salmonicida TaxID=40269 RepID=UPI00406D3AC7